MRMNKRELVALRGLDKITRSLQGISTAFITVEEANALKECLGFDVLESMTPLSEVNVLVRGKDLPLVALVRLEGEHQRPPVCLFFPFQIKEYNSNLITCPRCSSQTRIAR